MNDACLLSLALGCPGLDRLYMRNCEDVTDEGIEYLAQRCSQLTTINVSNCKKITDNGFMALAKGCAGLRNVVISNGLITSKALIYLSQGCPELELLHFDSCPVDDVGVQSLFSSCPRLT